MDKLKEAKRIHRNFLRRLDRLQVKIRNGDKKAAVKLIRVMTEENLALRKLNYMVSDEGGKIIPFVAKKYIVPPQLKNYSSIGEYRLAIDKYLENS